MRNKIKKQLCIIFILFVIFNILKTSSANVISLNSSKKDNLVKAGEIIEITITKGDNQNIAEIDGQIAYDTNLLEIVSYDNGKKYKNLSDKVEYFKLTQDNKFTIIDIANVESNIVTIGFKVKDGVEFDTTEIKFNKLSVFDTNLTLVIDEAEQVITLKNKSNQNWMNVVMIVLIILIIFAIIIKIANKSKKNRRKSRANRYK
ncbi:MAG: hypothetical protein J6A89_02510 [Clostridia bacterium]|nr:hypothetical protein [Clostridia bacterium]